MKGKQSKHKSTKAGTAATAKQPRQAPSGVRATHTSRRRNVWVYGVSALVCLLIVLPLMIYAGFWWLYQDKIYPGVRVEELAAAGYTQAALKTQLIHRVEGFVAGEGLPVHYQTQEWLIPLPQPEAWQVEAAATQAFSLGRQGPWQERLRAQWQAWRQGTTAPLTIDLPADWLDEHIATIAAQLDRPLIPPLVSLTAERQVVATAGEPGRKTAVKSLEQDIVTRLTTFDRRPITVTVEPIEIKVSPEQLDEARQRGERVLQTELRLVTNDQTSPHTWTLRGADLLPWIDVTGGWKEAEIEAYLTEVAAVVDRPPQNAKFQFDPESERVVEFAPALDGLVVDVTATRDSLMTALVAVERDQKNEPIVLTMGRSEPEITLSSINDLGITELLGRGESTYKGSIAPRVHNVALAATRLNGTLVKPGGTFSFNGAVGEISGATGYQTAYIIQNGRTVLGDGGGVCQDSTTVFRAALDAGLPITERRAHAYRVGYYEQNAKAGLDATVYSPSTDFKFVNDTPGHLLIQATADTPNRYLVVEIYGTSDGRKATVANHEVWGVTPPPPDVYVDEPTLPSGEVKQVDWKAWGAKAKFDYTVVRDGEIIYEKAFSSNFKPWAAVYLRGTGP